MRALMILAKVWFKLREARMIKRIRMGLFQFPLQKLGRCRLIVGLVSAKMDHLHTIAIVGLILSTLKVKKVLKLHKQKIKSRTSTLIDS